MRSRKSLLIGAAVLAAGLSGMSGGAAFARSTPVTQANGDEKIAEANAPADHEAIAAFYRQEAAQSRKYEELHQRTADTYRRLKIPKPVYMAEMCDNIAADFKKTATTEDKIAQMQDEMAKESESR